MPSDESPVKDEYPKRQPADIELQTAPHNNLTANRISETCGS